ncbi:Integrase, catalytic core domain protein, partial [mine drainage metagenome]
EPIIQSDNGSAFISFEFKTVLKANNLTHKRIRPHTPKDNAIVERVNKTVRENIEATLITDYQDAIRIIDQTIEWYNNKRRHSSLNYLPPKEYYIEEPEILLAVREAKLEMAREIRKENNMKK